jgi:hypothetical protein
MKNTKNHPIVWLENFFNSFLKTGYSSDDGQLIIISPTKNLQEGIYNTVNSNDTNLRQRNNESIIDFLQRRKENGNGIWIIRDDNGDEIYSALFDVDLEIEKITEDHYNIKKCNCAYYSHLKKNIIKNLQNEETIVALRYEADFDNTGQFFIDHPNHHLEWNKIKRTENNLYGSEMTRLKVPEMFPSQFFEFCLRHYAGDVWSSKLIFSDSKQELINLKKKINSQNDRRSSIIDEQENIIKFSNKIHDACTPPAKLSWGGIKINKNFSFFNTNKIKIKL